MSIAAAFSICAAALAAFPAGAMPSRTRISRWFALGGLAAIVCGAAVLDLKRNYRPPPSWSARLGDRPAEIAPGGSLFYLGASEQRAAPPPYAVQTGDGLVLIDPPASLEHLHRALAELGLSSSQIREIILTHRNVEGWRTAGVLARQSGARVHSGEADEGLTKLVPRGVEPLRDGQDRTFAGKTLQVFAEPPDGADELCLALEIGDRQVLFSGSAGMQLHRRLLRRFNDRRAGANRWDLALPGRPWTEPTFDSAAFARRINRQAASLGRPLELMTR